MVMERVCLHDGQVVYILMILGTMDSFDTSLCLFWLLMLHTFPTTIMMITIISLMPSSIQDGYLELKLLVGEMSPDLVSTIEKHYF